MAIGSMLLGLGGRNAAQSVTGKGRTPIDDSVRLAMLDSLEVTGTAWFWATDAKNTLTYLSAPALDLFGDDAKVIGEPLASIVQPAGQNGAEGAQRPLSFILGGRTKFSELIVQVEANGSTFWWALGGRPFFDENGEFQGFRGSATDITRQHEQQLSNDRLAQYDQLTGLANRHRMAKLIDSSLTNCKLARRSCALLMMDLDRFKQVNDTMGHPAGDELLRQVSARLQRVLHRPAEIGRLGGDEFQVIIPDMDDRGKLGELAQKVIQMVSQPYSLEAGRAVIGCSVGIAVAPYDGVTAEELVSSADLALYAAKNGGRGQYRFYVSDLARAKVEQRELGGELADAIAAEELALHYQPIVRTADDRVVAFEALLRWDHPERGMLPPAIFLPVAEESGLMDDLCAFVLRKACREAAAWPESLRVSVNVSAQQFGARQFPEYVAEALTQSGLDPDRLELEITESVFLGETTLVDCVFDELKRLGVRLALDDFGTGYSSLGYLRRVPIDKIKIDQSFVRGASEQDNFNSAIITAIISLAGALGVETTAEGVEAMDELELVRELGADTIQGFIYSRAVPPEVVAEKLASGDFHYEAIGPDRHRAERRTVYRRIGVIHEDHRYEAVLRNLSRTGALIEGLLDVPVGTDLVLDLGQGQLAVATVRRSQDATQGVEFETPLVSDGADGLCTRHRVSPYALAAAGMPLTSLQGMKPGTLGKSGAGSRPCFMQVDVSAASSRAA